MIMYGWQQCSTLAIATESLHDHPLSYYSNNKNHTSLDIASYLVTVLSLHSYLNHQQPL